MANSQLEPLATHTPSIGELLRRLVDDTQHLFRTEIKLAQSEMKSNVAAAAKGAVGIGIGAILLLGAVFTLLGAAVAFLTPLVGAGWAALIVTLIAGGLGGVLIMMGLKKLSASSLIPDRAIASVRQDANALKGQG